MKKIRLARFLAAVSSLLPSSNKMMAAKGKHLPPPFFIISSGRSGSTLLNRMLNEHTKLFLPSEQYFLGVSIIKYRIYRSLLVWRDLVKIILGELLVSRSHTWTFQQPSRLFDDLLYLEKEERSLQIILDTIFKAYASQCGKRNTRWGDSTPLNAHYIREVQAVFPAAAFIFLIRDGREVVSSFKKGGTEAFGPLANPVNAAHHWNKSTEALDFLKRKGCRIFLVKYEDLIANPANTLDMTCSFLGVGFEAGMLHYYQNIPDTPFYEDAHHHKLRTPVSNYANAWEEALTEYEREGVLKIIGHNLQRFGYL